MSQYGCDRHEYDDEDYDGPEDVCDCAEAELDWEGYFHCTSCNRRWDATAEQIAEYWQAYEDYHRLPSLRERISMAWNDVADWFRNLMPRKRTALDDDIPF